MNILLVYPKMPDTFYAMRHFLKVVGKKAAYPPLGLLTIAPLFPKSWNVKLLDTNLKDITVKDVENCDLVFLSAMNVQEESVREIIDLCNRKNKKIVAGGSLFTHEYDRFPTVDYFVLNEAEITLPQFIDDFKAGNPKKIYQTSEFADVEKSPIPAFELIDSRDYLFSIIQYSRGCPYMCDFCDVTALFGRRPRTKSSKQIIEELEKLSTNSHVSLVLFADDNLIGNKKILKSDLLPALIEWRKRVNPSFYFATQLTINLVDDPELMSMLLDAGFRHIFIGIETPDEDGLKDSRKTQNLKRNQLENIKKLHASGFIISGGFIVGFDTDTPSIFNQQVAFIQESGIPLPIVNILKAPPGTELFDRMKKEGRLVKRFAFSEGDTNLKPYLKEEVLFNGFIDLINKIYTPKGSYERLIQFFEDYKFPQTNVKIPYKFNWSDLKIFFRVFWLLGIVDKNRKYFWKLIKWTYFNNRKFMDKALFYGVMIYQMNMTLKHIRANVEENLIEFQNSNPSEEEERLSVAG